MIKKLKLGSLATFFTSGIALIISEDPDSKLGAIFRSFQFIYVLVLLASVLVFLTILYKEFRANRILKKASLRDNIWDEDELKVTTRGMFYKIQYAMAEFNTNNLKEYLTPEFLLTFTNEVQKLRTQNRKIEVDSIDVAETRIVCCRDYLNNDKDRFVAYIKGNIDLESGSNGFEEMYHFIRNDNDWLLTKIDGDVRLINILFENSFIEKEKH